MRCCCRRARARRSAQPGCCGTQPKPLSGARTPSSPARSCSRCRQMPRSRSTTELSSRDGSRWRTSCRRAWPFSSTCMRHTRATRTRRRQLACAPAHHDAAHWSGGVPAAKKARDLEPDVRRVAGRAMVNEGEAWGEVWRDLQNRYFAEVGIDLRVDPTGAFAQAHIGPIRMRRRTRKRTLEPTKSRARTPRLRATRIRFCSCSRATAPRSRCATLSGTSPNTLPGQEPVGRGPEPAEERRKSKRRIPVAERRQSRR